LVAGLCAAAEVRGQERVVVSAGATLQASATVLPSIDAASFAGLVAELPPSWNETPVRAGAWHVTLPRPTDGTTHVAALLDPPVVRSFERIAVAGRSTLLQTIAVLY
jgi:hypothetical protein